LIVRRPLLIHGGTRRAAEVVAIFLQVFPAGEVVDLSTPAGARRFQELRDESEGGPVTLETLPIIYKG
jgi:hypothetical protein